MDGCVTPDWLMLLSEVTVDMTHWEMHPDGEEVFCLFTGHLGVMLNDGMAQQTVELDAGPADAPMPISLVMPRGIWHRFEVPSPAASSSSPGAREHSTGRSRRADDSTATA
jgi:hypothetical protein